MCLKLKVISTEVNSWMVASVFLGTVRSSALICYIPAVVWAIKWLSALCYQQMCKVETHLVELEIGEVFFVKKWIAYGQAGVQMGEQRRVQNERKF